MFENYVELNYLIMKRQIKIITGILLISTLLWSCSKSDDVMSPQTLKQAIDQSAINLNSAMAEISSTEAFSILTVNNGTQKSAILADSVYKVSITLDSVKGVYDYHPVISKDRWGRSLIRFFTRSSDDSKMIVRMPLEKVLNPRSLRFHQLSDTSLVNNFSISVSDYHNNYNNYHDFDYLLNSEISIDDKVAGNLNIDYFKSPADGIRYASQYAFANSYTADYRYESGDTTVSSFSITGDGKVLYEEKLLTIKNDSSWFGREHQYILTIGDVQITRKLGTHTAEVSVNGILQPGAVVSIVDTDQDQEVSVCRHREIQITFEDGTTTTISALIGNSIEDIKTLFNSLHQVYFAAYVVDWIAYDIYYNRD